MKGHLNAHNNNDSSKGLREITIIRIIVIFSIIGFVAILVRAFQLQIIEHPRWMARYEAQIFASYQLTSFRSPIVDRNGRPLAITVRQPSVYTDPSRVESPTKTATALSNALGIPKKAILKSINEKKRRFVWIKRHISDAQAYAVLNSRLRGIHVIYEQKRFYPQRFLAGHLIGFVGTDGRGLEGVEKYFDAILTEKEKTVKFMRDAIGRRIFDDSFPYNSSKSLVLNVDSFIQYTAEKALEQMALKYNPASAQVVALDPYTFEVLAIANWPSFNPNIFYTYSPEARKNRAITDIFEPGSVIKPILIAAALEEKMIKPTQIVFCENGTFNVPGHTIRDTHPHGWLTIPQVIKFSSNIGAAKLALQFGAEKYYEYLTKFGFGKTTGVDFPGEVPGIIRHWTKWRPIDLAASAFGQGIGVTTLQLCSAFAIIANGGFKGTPAIKANIDNHRTPVQVISPETANIIRNMLIQVTQEGGTGVMAAVPGYTIAGKTGTAQRLDVSAGSYSRSDYSSLFVGFAPAHSPKIVIAVVVHSPHGAIYGGVVAAPVFRDIAKRVLPHLGALPKEVNVRLEKREQGDKNEQPYG